MLATTNLLGAQPWGLNATVDAPPPNFPFEAIDECWFPSVEVAARALTAPAMQRLTDDLAKVCAVQHNVTMLTRPTHRWPRKPKL